MNRRELLKRSAAFGFMAAVPFAVLGRFSADAGPSEHSSSPDGNGPSARPNPLKPPAQGSIPVAFLISEGAVIIDFCGPWEVFQDVSVPGRAGDPFHLYTVAETTKPIRASSGMRIIPDYNFETTPPPKVIVIPAQMGRSQATLEWIRKSAKSADVTMSVCTGAFLLAGTGLLSGKAATTHHDGYRSLAMEFPDIQVKRGARFVEDGTLATAGGLSSGIDLALRVVERYFGEEVARQTAYEMEYQGQGWMNPSSNTVYAPVRISTDEHPLCPVCEMDVDPKFALTSVYKGKTYYFCSQEHKQQFDSAPAKFIEAMKGN
jgi:YHS domain-containing protein/putative intracellular protease/amidase